IVGSTQPTWQNGMMRAEYKLDGRDAVSFDGTVTGGDYTRDNVSYSTNIDEMGTIVDMLTQTNDQFVRYWTGDVTLGFHRTGDKNQRSFSSQARFEETSGTIATKLFGDALRNEHDLTRVAWPQWTVQADYTQPLGGGDSFGTKLEMGVKEIAR